MSEELTAVSPDLECTACAPGVTSPDGVPATPGQAAYEGLSPYGIAIMALERILDLDAGWMSWDEARAIASEAATLAVARSAAEQPAPELAAAIDPDKLDLLADWFDNDDAIRRRLGNPEVQADLRRWAKAVRDARAGLPS